MGARTERLKRALEVTSVARQRRILRVLRELGVVGERPATREGAVEFRRALEELGTTYLKLGQLLASRPDLLPDVYIEELGKLVDEVPPFPFSEVEQVVREDLGPDVFARLEPEPLAAASIGQIHPALLRDGRDVVVKVRRPGIVEQVELDLGVIRSAVGFLEDRSETAQLLQLRALADELENHLRAELDFEEEASNTELIAGLLEDFDDLIVPKVMRPHVTERVARARADQRQEGHARARARARAGREPRRRLLPRLHPAGHAGRRLPRRPAPRERAPDRGRPPRAARLRPARAAR